MYNDPNNDTYYHIVMKHVCKCTELFNFIYFLDKNSTF